MSLVKEFVGLGIRGFFRTFLEGDGGIAMELTGAF